MEKTNVIKNLGKIKEYLKGKTNISVLLAYGNNISKRPYLEANFKDIINELKHHNPTFYRLGKPTKKGNPWHPLYVHYKTAFEVVDYL